VIDGVLTLVPHPTKQGGPDYHKKNVHVVPEFSLPRLPQVFLLRQGGSTILLAHVGLPMYVLTIMTILRGMPRLYRRDGRIQRHTTPSEVRSNVYRLMKGPY
jgi:hypothetical protein